jgi:hypothetical protein
VSVQLQSREKRKIAASQENKGIKKTGGAASGCVNPCISGRCGINISIKNAICQNDRETNSKRDG